MAHITDTQIHNLAQRLIARHPDHADRIRHASRLLLDGDVYANNNGTWTVLSSANDGTGYTVDGHSCTCPDYLYGRAPRIRGRKFCKHRLAVEMLKRWIAEQIQRRNLGRGEHTARRKQESQPMTWLAIGARSLVSETTGIVCAVRWSETLEQLVPASEEEYIRALRWLENAQPVPTSGPGPIHPETVEEADARILPYQSWKEIYHHI